MNHKVVIGHVKGMESYKVKTTEEVLDLLRISIDIEMSDIVVTFNDGSFYKIYGKDYLDEA